VKEIRIGVDIGKTIKQDRGISVYTWEILRRFKRVSLEEKFKLVLFYYPDRRPDGNFRLPDVELRQHPYSDSCGPIKTLICEQIVNPIYQGMAVGLDVLWHPHNRARLVNPINYVVTLHDVLPLSRPDLAGYLESLRKRLLYWSRTYAARFADKIITTSHFSQEEIIKYLGANPDRVVVIYSGVNREIFKPHKDQEEISEVKRRYGLPTRYILTTGSYAPHKNHLSLIEAYRRSNLPKIGVGFVMVGPNDASGYRKGYNLVKEEVEKRGLSGRVKVLPSVPLDDLVLFYNGAEFFTTASLYEGFGLTPLEAMACGVPVIASRVAAIPEICGDAACYADPNNPMKYAELFDRLIADTALRHQLVEKGSIRVKKFDWFETTERTLEVIMSVVNYGK